MAECVACEGPINDSVSLRCVCGRLVHSTCAAKCKTCLAECCTSRDNYVAHVCREPETVAQEILEESGSEWDTDNDSDLELARMTLEQAEDEAAEEAEDTAFLSKGARAENARMPEDGLYVHVVHRTAHKATKDGTTACGVIVSDITHEFLSRKDTFSHVRLCWRGGCAPWGKAEEGDDVEVESSDGFDAALNELEGGLEDDGF